jgi:hypothetical protein
MDQLYAGWQPANKQTGAVVIAESQTLTRGAAIGKALFGAVSVVAGANTGDGTCTAAATVVGTVQPIVGDYVVKCTAAVTNGGVFQVADPNGGIVAAGLSMTVGAGAATVIETAGLTFTLTDGTTDFVIGDLFTLTVAAGSGQGYLLDKTAVDGSAVLYGILTNDVTTAAAETQSAPVDKTGRFNTSVVTFADGTAYTDVEEDARTKSHERDAET